MKSCFLPPVVVRDQGLLESAVWSVDAAFGEVERYPSIEEKAARLAYALISNHAFVDGSKRVGINLGWLW